MKLVFFLSALLISTCALAQSGSLVSKVYSWDNSSVSSKKKATTREIFSGSGAILSQHEMRGIELAKRQSKNYKANVNGNERFFVIKKGPVKVSLNGKKYTVDRGSVIFVLPGDQMTIENAGDQTAAYYAMVYHSKAPVDAERGKKSGPSFVMDWKDMIAKPTDKGSTRQLFDRQTAMLNRFDIHVTQLNQGLKSHDPHTHTNEEIILMLDGNAEMQIGTDHQKANGGDVVLLNSMVLHNLTNVGTTPCLYFAIQWN